MNRIFFLTLFVISLHSAMRCLLRAVSSWMQRRSLDVHLQAEMAVASLPPQQLCSTHHSFCSSRRPRRASTSSQRVCTAQRHAG